MKSLTRVELSKSALRHQVRLFKKAIGDSQLHLVVKSNAYGHGVEAVVTAVNAMSEVSGYMVASLDEALALRKLTRKPVTILSYWERDSKRVRAAVRSGIAFPIYNREDAVWLSRISHSMRRRVRAHIKVDVGTMRLGFRYDTGLNDVRAVLNLSGLSVVGIFSHFASSEDSDESFTRLQEKRFASVIGELVEEGYDIPEKHIACSAAALRNADYHYNVVRLGVSLYGLWPSQDLYDLIHRRKKFRPVLEWKTQVIHVKELKKGEGVGYGLTWKASRRTTVAVLPVGYWDGFDRRLSNNAEVLIRGKRCKVRGNICMNVLMVEVPKGLVSIGDEVTLIGKQGREVITADDLAKDVGTIHYEIVTRINPLITRVLVS